MKVCVISGSRAEYGLLRPLLQELTSDNYFDVSIIATGMHLSSDFGQTYKEIENDGFKIIEKIEILLSSDTSVGVSKAMGLAMISFSEAYQRIKPDLVIGLGDRFELFSAVSAASVAKIPVAHIHGGELTFGAYDEGFRHAITKMSHIHFTSTEIYRRRVIQMGENPKNVFNVGALGIDNIKRIKLLSKAELQEELNFYLGKYFVVCFHPVTLDHTPSETQLNQLLEALDNFKSHQLLFSYPNADNGSRVIKELINDYIQKNPKRSKAWSSLGSLKYLSALKHSDMLIGNSSSGIIEMPYFDKPTINVGDRQDGRVFPDSVITTFCDKYSIMDGINTGLNSRFLIKIKKQKKVYGSGNTSKKIKQILIGLKIDTLLKKKFHDINEKSIYK